MKIILAQKENCSYAAFANSLLNGKHEIYQITKPIKQEYDIPYNYDLGIGYLYPYKIPTYELAKATWINFHPGLLPKYGGRNVVYHAIMNEEIEFGGTLHYMNEDFDSGDIIDVEKFPIEEYDTAGDVIYKTYEALWRLFKKYIPKILNEESIPRIKQKKRSYYRLEKINNEITLNDKQKKVIRALTVHHKFHPVITIAGKRYKIVPEV